MKDQVLLSKNVEICVGVPLYRGIHTDSKDSIFLITIQGMSHIAYLIETRVGCIVWSKEFVEKNFEFLGDL